MSKEIVKQEKQEESVAIKKVKATGNFKTLKPSEITEVVGNMVDAYKGAINKIMGSEKFVTIISTVFQKNPGLRECTLESIVGAVQEAATVGLDVTPALKLCYFQPYFKNVKIGREWVQKKELSFNISYMGLIELARRSGQVSDIYAEIIYDTDEHEITYGLKRDLIHKPSFKTDEYNSIKFVYAVAHLKDGTRTFVVLTNKRVEFLRKLAPNQKNKKTNKPSETPIGIWELHYGAMAKAKAIRDLSKYLPLTPEEKAVILKPEDMVTKNSIDAPPKNYFELHQNAYEEYQDQLEAQNDYDDYDVNQETGEIQAVDKQSDFMSEIEKDAKK